MLYILILQRRVVEVGPLPPVLVTWPLFQSLFIHWKGDGNQGLKVRLSANQSPLRLFPSPVFFISKDSIFQSDDFS